MIRDNHVIKLHPVLALHGYAVQFPLKAGTYTCEFRVLDGSIEIRQKSFDMYSGLWDEDGSGGGERIYYINAGERKHLTFVSEIHDYEPDLITIANHSYLKPAKFSYQIQSDGQDVTIS